MKIQVRILKVIMAMLMVALIAIVSPKNANAISAPTQYSISPSSVDSGEAFRISWSAVSGAYGYAIQISLTPSFSTFYPAYVSSSKTYYDTYDIVDVTTIYYVRIFAEDVYGSSSIASNVKTVTIYPLVPFDPEGDLDTDGNGFYNLISGQSFCGTIDLVNDNSDSDVCYYITDSYVDDSGVNVTWSDNSDGSNFTICGGETVTVGDFCGTPNSNGTLSLDLYVEIDSDYHLADSFNLSVSPAPVCSSECAYPSTGCNSTTQKWTCGNNDADACYEKVPENCASGYVCSNGSCILGCSNECTSGTKGCNTTTQAWSCGELNDGDICWDKVPTNCSSGYSCYNGNCVQIPTLNTTKTNVYSGQSYTISWNLPTGIAKTYLQVANNPGFSSAITYPLNSPIASKVESYTTTGSLTYYYRVIAEYSNGDLSQYSNVVIVTTSVCTPNWSCGTWSCSGLNRTRICTDINECAANKTETETCSEACSAGVCVCANAPVCTSSSSTGCDSATVRWYCGNTDADSCLEKINQTCTYGCSLGACVTCTANHHTGCDGDNLRWYDSCNQAGSLIEDCTLREPICSSDNGGGFYYDGFCTVVNNLADCYYANFESCDYDCENGACNDDPNVTIEWAKLVFTGPDDTIYFTADDVEIERDISEVEHYLLGNFRVFVKVTGTPDEVRIYQPKTGEYLEANYLGNGVYYGERLDANEFEPDSYYQGKVYTAGIANYDEFEFSVRLNAASAPAMAIMLGEVADQLRLIKEASNAGYLENIVFSGNNAQITDKIAIQILDDTSRGNGFKYHIYIKNAQGDISTRITNGQFIQLVSEDPKVIKAYSETIKKWMAEAAEQGVEYKGPKIGSHPVLSYEYDVSKGSQLEYYKADQPYFNKQGKLVIGLKSRETLKRTITDNIEILETLPDTDEAATVFTKEMEDFVIVNGVAKKFDTKELAKKDALNFLAKATSEVFVAKNVKGHAQILAYVKYGALKYGPTVLKIIAVAGMAYFAYEIGDMIYHGDYKGAIMTTGGGGINYLVTSVCLPSAMAGLACGPGVTFCAAGVVVGCVVVGVVSQNMAEAGIGIGWDMWVNDPILGMIPLQISGTCTSVTCPDLFANIYGDWIVNASISYQTYNNIAPSLNYLNYTLPPELIPDLNVLTLPADDNILPTLESMIADPQYDNTFYGSQIDSSSGYVRYKNLDFLINWSESGVEWERTEIPAGTTLEPYFLIDKDQVYNTTNEDLFQLNVQMNRPNSQGKTIITAQVDDQVEIREAYWTIDGYQSVVSKLNVQTSGASIEPFHQRHVATQLNPLVLEITKERSWVDKVKVSCFIVDSYGNLMSREVEIALDNKIEAETLANFSDETTDEVAQTDSDKNSSLCQTANNSGPISILPIMLIIISVLVIRKRRKN